MAENKKYNSILVSGRKDETLTYSRYIKDEETGKSVKESLDGKINTTDKIEIEQIAQAVWDKLKDEYLRRDGKNFMQGDLRLNGNRITGITELRDNSSLSSVIAFNKDGYDIKFEQWSTSGGDEDPSPDFIGGFSRGEFKVPLNITALGFETIDRTNIGLLVNDGSVGLAMSDSDIDGLFQQVFQTVIG